MMALNLLDAHRDDPMVMNALKTGSWRQELCGCFDNCSICIMTYFLPCVQFGLTAEGLGKSCCVYGCLYTLPIADLIVHINQREEIRQIRGIPGECCDDFLFSVFCRPCSLCQEAAEVEAIKTDIVNVLAARNQGTTVIVQSHMQPYAPAQQVSVSPGNMARV